MLQWGYRKGIEAAMQTVKLGSQGAVVSRMGLGCMSMSEFYGERDDVESTATLLYTRPMTGRIDTTIEFRRTLSRGPAAVYVLPHRGEAFLKLGFSRDPLARMQSLHPRYFDFFDIERSILIETPRVNDARNIETALKRRFAEHRAPAPLDIRHEAGGESEWYRGAYEAIAENLDEYEAMGYIVLRGARARFAERLTLQTSQMFEWAVLQWRAMNEGDAFVVARATRALTDALDAYRWFEIDVAGAVPPEVAAWYEARR
jgi:hypothetical protein